MKIKNTSLVSKPSVYHTKKKCFDELFLKKHVGKYSCNNMHIYARIWFQGEPDFGYLPTTKDHLFHKKKTEQFIGTKKRENKCKI